jgi:hypothetical protein
MRLPLAALTALCLVSSSCKKVYETLAKDPDAIGRICRVDTLVIGFPSYEQVAISYDRDGNPTSMTPLIEISSQFSETSFFRYDPYKRLKDYIVAYRGVAVDLWHRFSYPAPRVVIDSFFNYDGPGTSFGPNPPPYPIFEVYRYTLDDQGRIIKTTIQYFNGQLGTYYADSTYTVYDLRGNMEIPGAVYDDKVNIYRTNKVWQLIFQDYSKNNRIYPADHPDYQASITSYNPVGLPLIYMSNPPDPFLSLFNYQSPQYVYLRVSYNCDCQRQSQSTTSH